MSQSFLLPVNANWEYEMSCDIIVKISRVFFWSERKIKVYRAFLQRIMNQTKEIKAKKLKVSYIVIDNGMMVDLLMYTKI